MNKIDANKELDCSGLNCPLPVLKTKKILDNMVSGEILKMISTDPGSKNDVTAWISRTENEILSIEDFSNKLIFFIRKA